MASGVDALASYADRPPPLNEPTRLARLMGLEDSRELDDVELARRVANGLPTTVVIAFARILGRSKVIGLMIPEATYRRLSKRGKPLSRDHSERIYEVGRILDALARVYHGNLDNILAFLHHPHMLLGGETPFDMARSSSAGAETVLNLILRAEAGMPV